MAILNITLQGISADYSQEIDFSLPDREIKRIALELVQSGSISGLHIAGLPAETFAYYVVDRFETPQGGQRIYLRPKVPFGGK